MSIKSDNWIRRMAATGMIEPFAAEQVRSVDGRRIVSYGTSSYGYDVRCASEFKIFTNINSTIVDPKAFDPQSFVDVTADVCIIPPNSFALARTVEYFRIPRSVLTICLGKCVSGDTRVVDAESGAYLPITEMRFGRRTLAMDDWRLRPASVSAFVPQGRRLVYQLQTRAGLRIRATANHPFLRIGGWTALESLVVGDRIAIAREIPVFGKTPLPDWEATLLGLMISEGQCHAPGHSPTFTSSDPVLVAALESSIAASGFGAVTYKGCCDYRLVNHPGRGGIPEPNRASRWLRSHGLAVHAGDKFVPQAVFTAPRESARLFLQALFAGDGGLHRNNAGVVLEYFSKSRRLIEDVQHLLLRFGIFSVIREKTTTIGTSACWIQITDYDQIARFGERVGFLTGSIKDRRLQDEIMPLVARGRMRSNFDTLPNEAWPLVKQAVASTGMSLNSIGLNGIGPQSVSLAAVRTAAAATGDATLGSLLDGPLWDVVRSITPAGEEEVYDISVPNYHNFLANGIVVHNSTYARCFRGDTRVALVDGTAPTLEEMAHRAGSGEWFFGYSIGAHGRLIVALLEAPRFIGRDALVEIQLDDGALIHVTPDHLFMARDGLMVAADSLRPSDSLMPLYRHMWRGHEIVYQPLDGRAHPTRRLAVEWTQRHGVQAAVRRAHRHDLRRFPQFDSAATRRAQRNHKVASIRTLPGDHDVYCLSVPEAGNFALAAGVFVHNCGIIVNVTPLEPEWEGHVTLEFSNTTPLPAKIYANEGVAQMLFFESDEVCATSYRDRDGKYMGQRGVTLPKA